MRIDVNLDRLWNNVKAMGAEAVAFDLDSTWGNSDIEFDQELSRSGIEISLDDLESEQGLLSVRGRQVVLFIPDHSYRVQSVMDFPPFGNKFHIADCKTLDNMRSKNRFERYRVTNNLSGSFEIFGTGAVNELIEGRANLSVCKNCLNMLNYQDARQTSVTGRNKVVEKFDVEEFFSTYSSVFKYLPKHDNNNDEKGYAENWKEISANLRQQADYTCHACAVKLTDKISLLHVHHKNGVKSDNSDDNLVVLCADCHKKQPYHNHLFVKHTDIQLINRLRDEQGVLTIYSWNSVYQFADTAVHGILNLCQYRGWPLPVVGYKITDSKGAVITELELAWPDRKLGVYLDDEYKVDGWQLLNHEKALNYF